MTNNGKKIACVALASALCLGVGFSAVLPPLTAFADSYASYGNSYVSGLGIQPTMSAVLYEVGGEITDPTSFYQYRTNLDGYADGNSNYTYTDTYGTFVVDSSIAYAGSSKTLDLNYYQGYYADLTLQSVSFSSCMPSSPRLLHSSQWFCWQSLAPRVNLHVEDVAYTPTAGDEVSAEIVIYAYARGENADSNTPYLRTYTFPCTTRVLAGRVVCANPLPSFDEFIASNPDVLHVSHDDGTPAGIMGSIAFNFSTDIEGLNEVHINDSGLNSSYMAYNNYQSAEVDYMEQFAVLNNVTRYDIDPLSSMWNVVDGFFSAELFPGFKIGDLLAIAIGSLLLGLFLKIFLGG